MGVVIKQSFWGTFIAYCGVAIGYINILYLRPKFFELDQIGLFTIITAHAMMISPLSGLGMGSSFIKFFPSFQEPEKNRFFTFLFLITVIGNIIVISTGYLMRGFIVARYAGSAPQYINYLVITAVVVIVNSLFDLFFSYSRTIMKVIFPSLLRDIFLRLGAVFLVAGFALDWFSFDWAARGLAFTYSAALLLLFLQLFIRHNFRFDFDFSIISKDWKRRLFQFALYSTLMAGSYAVINNTTYDQVVAQLGTVANGIFTTCFFIGAIVEMPRRNMAKIMAPIISSGFENKNMESLDSLYKRSSITMSTIGCLLFIGIITNLQDLFSYIPQGEAFSVGFWIVVAVCSAKLIVMVSSFPGEIINFSPYYKFNLLFQLGAAGLLIVLNHYLIKLLGLNGASIGYLFATSTHIVLKVWYVHCKFKIHPFISKHVSLLIISVLTGLFAWWYDTSLPPLLDIIIRYILTSILFLVAIVRFKVSTDINNLVRSTFDRFLNFNRSK